MVLLFKKKHVRSKGIDHSSLRIPEVDDARSSSHLWAYAQKSGIQRLPKLESSYTYKDTQIFHDFHRETSQASLPPPPPQRLYDVSRGQNRYVTLP